MDYSGYNRALGKYIRGKYHYFDEMKRQGMVSYEEGEDIARKAREKSHKDYKLNEKTEKFLSEVNMRAKNGKVKLSGREIDYMEKIGVSFKKPEYLGQKGGWNRD